MDSLVKPLTWLFGVVFIAIGILGFVQSPILGLFGVNTAHDIVHILSGVAALGAAAGGYRYAKLYLMIFGLVYALVTVAGFLGLQQVIDLLALDTYDNYLHLVISIVTLVVGFGSTKGVVPSPVNPAPMAKM